MGTVTDPAAPRKSTKVDDSDADTTFMLNGGAPPAALENMMKIGQTTEKPAAQAATAANDAAKASTAPTANAIPAQADPSAKIAISSEATNLLSNQGSADFDAEKVAKISSAIDKGTFKINPEAIADKLISNAKEVLTKT